MNEPVANRSPTVVTSPGLLSGERIRFASEKRALLGILALLAPLPMPWNDPRPRGVIHWSSLLVFSGLVGFFLWRSKRDLHRPPSTWMLNLLGFLYVPIFALDLLVNGRILLIRPMVHLALFALVAKLFALERERDKWHALVGIFFLFVVSAATNTSVFVVPYLLVFLVAGTFVLMRFAALHAKAYSSVRREKGSDSVSWSTTLTLCLVVVVAAIPFFLVMPRFDQPYLDGSFMAGLDANPLGGEDVTLDSVGRIRESRAVVLRIEAAQGVLPKELRLRSASYDRLIAGHWRSDGGLSPLAPDARGRFEFSAPQEVLGRIRLWSAPTRSPNLVLPTQAVAVEVSPAPSVLVRNRQGDVKLPARPRGTYRYEVDVGAKELPLSRPPYGEEGLDLSHVGDLVYRLAHEITAEESPLERAKHIESYLLSGYQYTLDLGDRGSADPIEEFLFRSKSGHCELFAASMVALLRATGIPARFVTGYLGAESTALGYSIVRQSNAHAWVEAYLPEVGWLTFDPTPPAGRPRSGQLGYGDLLRQAYDWVVFAWDRNVVGFGRADQIRIWERWREWIQALLSGEEGAEIGVTETATSVEGATASVLSPRRLAVWLVALALALAASLFGLLRHRRRAGTSVALIAAYQRVLRRAERRVPGWPQNAAPLAAAHQLHRAVPDSASDIDRFFEAYLAVSYGGRGIGMAEGEKALRSAGHLLRALRRQDPTVKRKRAA